MLNLPPNTFLLLSLPLLLSLLLLTPTPTLPEPMTEKHRLSEYDARNYTWPPKYHPSTPGWSSLLSRRFSQIAHMKSSVWRYDAYMQTVNSAYVVPNFTTTGWGLARAPPDLFSLVRDRLHRGIASDETVMEHRVDVIEGSLPPLFIHDQKLMNIILDRLHGMHERWSGVPLVGSNAYGFRLYQNRSFLNMHVDKPGTHVISCIFHVGRSDDAEPWPLVIEDYDGRTNEVFLEPGDVLFYESSKCLHGRPRAFEGSWYNSVFVHYHPVDWDVHGRKAESHYGVPRHWNTYEDDDCAINEKGRMKDPNNCESDGLVMRGTSMKEPRCPDNWCALKDSAKWYGPAKEGYVITSRGEFPLEHGDYVYEYVEGEEEEEEEL